MRRAEHPRPQLERERWLCLNGTWELAYDPGDVGLREGWEHGRAFERRIEVPFPVESELSGVADPAPPAVVWYRREVEVPDDLHGARTRLHIGACDYETRVWVNGRAVAHHRGGYDPIRAEVGFALRPGPNEIVVRAEDPATWTRPRGKQWAGAFRMPVDYDTVTGIWQSVWLEPLPAVAVEEVFTVYDLESGALRVNVVLDAPFTGEVEVELLDAGHGVARGRRDAAGRPEASLVLRVDEPKLWSPASPHLYELRVRLLDGEREIDAARSWAGLRQVTVAGDRILLNGEPVYLRGVLDQGYFPGGWYTAASDDALRRDVELTLALGLNCARKHQKAEDPRWLHWADRLGLLVWAEMPSGRDFSAELVSDLSQQWSALVRRDRGHACVVAWVPFNESWGVWNQAERPEQRAFVEATVALTRALDPSARPVVGNDGWEYTAGDLFTLHVYEGEQADVSARLRALLADPHGDVLPAGHVLGRRRAALPGADPSGLPVLLTECGGVGYLPPNAKPPEGVFAYGDLPQTTGELETRIRRVADLVRSCPELSGFVWTQLTDVQQEINGLLAFDRTPKLPLETLREIFEGLGRARVG